MKIDDVKAYFGSGYAFNKQTGMMHTCYYFWKRNGFIPIKTQLFLQEFTEGKLVASLDDLEPLQK